MATPVQQPGIYMNISSTNQSNSMSPSQQLRNRLSFDAVSPEDLPRCDLPPDPLQRIKKKYFDRQMSGGALSLDISQQTNKNNQQAQSVSVVTQDILLQQDKLKLQQQQYQQQSQPFGYSSNAIIGANQINTSNISISPNNRSHLNQSSFLKQQASNSEAPPMNPLRKLFSKPLLSRGRTNGNSEQLNQTANIIMPMSQFPAINKCISLERTSTTQQVSGEDYQSSNYLLNQVEYYKPSQQQHRQASLQGNIINDNLIKSSFSPISQFTQEQQKEYNQSQSFNGISQLKDYAQQQQQKQIQDPQQEIRYFQSNHSVPAPVRNNVNQNPQKPQFMLARQLLQPGEQTNNMIRQTPQEVFLSQNVTNIQSIISQSTVQPNYLSLNQQPQQIYKSHQQQQQEHQQFNSASESTDPLRPVIAPQFRPISSNKLQQVNPSWSEAPTLSLHPTITTPTISPRGRSALDDSPAIPPSEHAKISIIPVTFLASSEQQQQQIQTKQFSVISKINQTTLNHPTPGRITIATTTKENTLPQHPEGDFITVDAPQSYSISSNSIGGHTVNGGAVSSSVCEVPIERSDNSLPDHLQTIDVAAEDIVTSGEHNDQSNINIIHNTSKDQYEHQHIKVITLKQQEQINRINRKSSYEKKGQSKFKIEQRQQQQQGYQIENNNNNNSSSSSDEEIDKEINKQFHYHYNYLSGNETLQADVSEIKTSSQEDDRFSSLRQPTDRQDNNTQVIQDIKQQGQSENTFQIGNTSYVIPPYVEYKKDTKLRMQIIEGVQKGDISQEVKILSNQDCQLDKNNNNYIRSQNGITLVQSIIENSQSQKIFTEEKPIGGSSTGILDVIPSQIKQEGSDFIKNKIDLFKKDSTNSTQASLFFTSSSKLAQNNNINKNNSIGLQAIDGVEGNNRIHNISDTTNQGIDCNKEYFNEVERNNTLQNNGKVSLELEKKQQNVLEDEVHVQENGDSADEYRREGMLLDLLKNDSDNMMKDNKKELQQQTHKDAVSVIQEVVKVSENQDNQIDSKEIEKEDQGQEKQSQVQICTQNKEKEKKIEGEESINQGITNYQREQETNVEIQGGDEKQNISQDNNQDQQHTNSPKESNDDHSNSSNNSSPTYITKYSASNIANRSSPNTSTSNLKHQKQNYQVIQHTKSSINSQNSHSVKILGYHSDSSQPNAVESSNNDDNTTSNNINNTNINDNSKNENLEECSSKEGIDNSNNNNYRGKGNAVTINSILRKLSSKGLLQQSQTSPHTGQQQQQYTPTVNNNNDEITNLLTISPLSSQGQHEKLSHSQHNSRSKSPLKQIITSSEYDNSQQSNQFQQKQGQKYFQKGRSYSSNNQQHTRISQNSRDIILKQFAELKKIANHRSVSPISANTAGIELSSSSLDISATTTKTVSQKQGILHQLLQQAERPHTPSFSEQKNLGKDENEQEEQECKEQSQSNNNNTKEDKQNDDNSVLQPVNLHNELLNKEEEEQIHIEGNISEQTKKEQEVNDGIEIKRTESEQGIYNELSDLDKRLLAKDNNKLNVSTKNISNSILKYVQSSAGLDQQSQQMESNAMSGNNGSIKEQLRRIFDAYAENSRDANARTIVELQHLIQQNVQGNNNNNNKSVLSSSQQNQSQQPYRKNSSNSLNRMPQFIQKPINVNNVNSSNVNNNTNESNLSSSYVSLVHSSQQQQQEMKQDNQGVQINGEEDVDYVNIDSANEGGKLSEEQIKNCITFNGNGRLNKSNTNLVINDCAPANGGSSYEDKEKEQEDRKGQQLQQQHQNTQITSNIKKTYSVLHSKKIVNTPGTTVNSIHKSSYSPYTTKSMQKNTQINKKNNQSYQQSKITEIDSSNNNGRKFATDLKKVQSEQTNTSFKGINSQNQQKVQSRQQEDKKMQQFSAAQAFKPIQKKSYINSTIQQQQNQQKQQQQQQLPEEEMQKSQICNTNGSCQDDLQELEDVTKERSFEYWAEKIKNSDNPKQILDVWKLINRTSQVKN